MLKVRQVILLIQLLFLNISFIRSAATISTESTGTNEYKYNQLVEAIRSNDLKKLQELVSSGANVNEQLPYSLPLLIHAVFSEVDTDILKYLIENGADINSDDGSGLTALHFAAEGGDLNNVKILLEAGADINKVTNIHKSTALDAARQRLVSIERNISIEKIGSPNMSRLKNLTRMEVSLKEIIKLLENEEERRKKIIKKYNEEILKQIGESDYGSKSIPPLVKLSAQYLLADKYEDIPLRYRLGS